MFRIVSPRTWEVEIKTSFGLKFVSIFFDIFFAREKADFGSLSDSNIAFLGIIIMWPLDMGFISRTARQSLFSSI